MAVINRLLGAAGDGRVAQGGERQARRAQLALQRGVGRVARGKDDGVDIGQYHRLGAGSMQEIGGVAVDAVDPGIGDDLNARGVELSGPMVADILLQVHPGADAVDRQPDVMAAPLQQHRQTDPDPVAAPIGNDHSGARGGRAGQDVLRIDALSSQGGYYMAFGAQTPDAMVEQFRKGLQAIVRNGTYDRIQRKWQ